MYGGIDLGGTKIEARLLDSAFDTIDQRRIKTPRQYEAVVDALAEQVNWLRQRSDKANLSVGIGIPGLYDRVTGLVFTANLDAKNRPLAKDLAARVGEVLPFENDCKCFVLSEANGGAGEGCSSVFGLIIGTGVGGGICIDGTILQGSTGLPGEVGHIGVPAAILHEFGLPVLPCGCGRAGCYEAYLAGPALKAIANAFGEPPLSGIELAEKLVAGDAAALRIFNCWLRIAAELVLSIQLSLEPSCIVLGGGLSQLPGIASEISKVFEKIKLPRTRSPDISIARFGDSSGVRGAAMLPLLKPKSGKGIL